MTISVSNQLSNCENHAAIYSESSGYGIVNVVYATCKTISGCKNYGNLDVNTGCGIVGTTKCEKVENCENYGNINATSSYCGGIVGMTDFYAHFSNCKNYGDIYLKNTRILERCLWWNCCLCTNFSYYDKL